MRLLNRLMVGAALLALVALLPAKAGAATLTFNHLSTGTVYSLYVQENCTDNCQVNLTIDFSDPSIYDGQYIDAVQFKIDGAVPTAVDLDSTNAGDASQWNVLFANLNGNQCSGGDSNSVCAEFNLSTLGYGPLDINGAGSDDPLFWNFLVNWDTALVLGDNLISGNIRAAYNRANGKNFGIFSPGGGNFGGDPNGGGGGGGIDVPEPTTLALFGLGLVAAGYRARRRVN